MSVTITFLTYSTYTSQSIAVAKKSKVYLFIARQSRDRMTGVTHQNLIGYISAISKPIHFWFSQNYLLFKGYNANSNQNCPTLPVQFRNSNFNP